MFVLPPSTRTDRQTHTSLSVFSCLFHINNIMVDFFFKWSSSRSSSACVFTWKERGPGFRPQPWLPRHLTQAWNPSTQEQRQTDLHHTGLHSESQTSQSYVETLSQKQRKESRTFKRFSNFGGLDCCLRYTHFFHHILLFNDANGSTHL